MNINRMRGIVVGAEIMKVMSSQDAFLHKSSYLIFNYNF